LRDPVLKGPEPASTLIACVLNANEARSEGDEELSEAKRSSSNDDASEDEKSAGAKKTSDRRPGAPRKNQGDVGRVLRSVYDSTLNEDIPDDFLNLLGKLD
jgi:hypothetical protein